MRTNKKTVTPCLLLILLLYAMNGYSEIYRWVDEHGKSHFSDNPRESDKSELVTVKPVTYSSPEISTINPTSNKRPVRKRSNKIVMYGASWCGVCTRAKRYFKERKIPFFEYDIEKSAKGKRDYKRLKGKGVPIILVGNKRLNGFSPVSFESIY